jgi:putative DNA primase/helicase
MSADQIGIALKGKRNGSGWLVRCPCPNHGKGRGDRCPSLSIADGDDGRLLLSCFAGCEFKDVTAELKHRGLIEQGKKSKYIPPPPPPIDPDPTALEIWEQSETIHGTIAEEYLQRRGILLTPPALRHHRGAMVASVTQPHKGVIAIQRTPINADFTRGVRWTKGSLHSGAVRLGPPARVMGIAEGTETALTAMMLAGMTVWAALGRRMHRVELPPIVEEVHIFSENGDPGRSAAERATEVHRDLGRIVKVRRPPDDFNDFNDYLIADANAWQKE